MSEGNPNIVVEVTDARQFHCFRMVLNPGGDQIEIMLHARTLVDLIHKCSVALCEWQAQTSAELVDKLTRYKLMKSAEVAAADQSPVPPEAA